jgi:UDP-glucuronate decarboxylase
LLIRHDVTAPFFIETDEIYNLACPASPIHYQYNAIKTMKTSVMGAIICWRLAKRVNAKILQASTRFMEIHSFMQPVYWGHVNPIGERACYDEGKRSAETLCKYHKQNNVKIKIIRIFNTYGPKMHPNDGCSFEFYCSGFTKSRYNVYGQGIKQEVFKYVT